MGKAILTMIPEVSVFGQSVGCILPLALTMPVRDIFALCAKIKGNRPHCRVSINLLASHPQMAGPCLSISFHLSVNGTPHSKASMEDRAKLIQNWVHTLGLGVEDFDLSTFVSRTEFCKFMHDPISVF